MRPPSQTHLVIIPSYNTGILLLQTVTQALEYWAPVWVVIDGSTDGSGEAIAALGHDATQLRILSFSSNRGKGSAVLHGLRKAQAEGFTHALTMDADGQHPAWRIPDFMNVSHANPNALVLGLPVFDASAPLIRLRGRRISNWWANLETLWCGIGDSLVGFRVYPINDLRTVMERSSWMRGFDFDPEAAVRLCWRGLQPINVSAPIRYLRPDQGGVSHFNYRRDNVLLTWMHLRLMVGFILRFPILANRRLISSRR